MIDTKIMWAYCILSMIVPILLVVMYEATAFEGVLLQQIMYYGLLWFHKNDKGLVVEFNKVKKVEINNDMMGRGDDRDYDLKDEEFGRDALDR